MGTLPPDTTSKQKQGRFITAPIEWLSKCTFSYPFAWSTTVLVFLVAVLSTEVLLHLHIREAESEQRAATLAYASQLRARVDRELNTVLFLSSGLTSYLVVRRNNLDPEEVRDILATLHANSRHIRNFSIAINYRVEYVHPLTNNEKILGVDYRDLDKQWPTIKRAIESSKGTLSGPVDLIQGGAGFIYRTPIFIDNKYWGLLSTVVDSRSFFDSAFQEVDSARYEFAIRGKDGQGNNGDPILGDIALFHDQSAVLLEADVPNGKWVWAVRSKMIHGKKSWEWLVRGLGWVLAILSSIGIFALLRQRNELAQHAGFDSLTGLPNRRLLDDRLAQAIRRHTRTQNQQIGLLFIDLDNFKEINDRYGHKVGDIALRTAALRIRDEVRISDTVARWGGDEFVAIIEDANDEIMNQLILRLRQHISQPFDAEGHTFEMIAAIGSAMHPADALSVEDLLLLADQRMYEDKQHHKGG